MSWEDIIKSRKRCCKLAKGEFVRQTIMIMKSKGMRFTQDDVDVFSKGVANADCDGFKLKVSRWAKGSELPKGPQGLVRQLAANATHEFWNNCLERDRDYV